MERLIKQFIYINIIFMSLISAGHAESDNQFYFSGDFVTGISEMDDIQNSGAIAGTLISSTLNDSDVSGGFAGALGYEWKQFRFEAEYLWRYRFDFGAQFDDAGAGTGIGSNIETHSLAFKALWTYENSTKFTPYLGGAIGWANHDADTNRGNLATEIGTQLNSSIDNLTWSFITGSSYSLFDNWEIDASYRYTDLGDVEIGPFADGGLVEAEYISHDFTIGINYFF